MAFVCNSAVCLMFCTPDSRNSFLFSLKLSIAHDNLTDYTFINRNETFIFSPFLITSEFEATIQHIYFHGNIIICIISVRICPPCEGT